MIVCFMSDIMVTHNQTSSTHILFGSAHEHLPRETRLAGLSNAVLSLILEVGITIQHTPLLVVVLSDVIFMRGRLCFLALQFYCNADYYSSTLNLVVTYSSILFPHLIQTQLIDALLMILTLHTWRPSCRVPRGWRSCALDWHLFVILGNRNGTSTLRIEFLHLQVLEWDRLQACSNSYSSLRLFPTTITNLGS